MTLMTQRSLRSVGWLFAWMIFWVVLAAEVISVLGVAVSLVLHGPRGIVGDVAHSAYQGLVSPKSLRDSDRVFWRYMTIKAILGFIGLPVLWCAWKAQKWLRGSSE